MQKNVEKSGKNSKRLLKKIKMCDTIFGVK
jgi:hypothetical protein